MIKEKAKLEAQLKGGGSIINLPPVFSENAEHVYIACKNQIISYNSKTAKKLYIFKGLNKDIVGFGSICAEGVEHVTACSSDGKIVTWKASSALKLKELKLNVNVIYFKIFYQPESEPFGAKSLVCSKKLESNNYEFSLLDLVSGKLIEQWQLNIRNESKLAIDICNEGQYYAVIQGQFLYCNQFGSKNFKHIIKNRIFTCVACHPEKNIVLTGDNTGRVLLWNNIFSKYPTQAVYHWHTLSVKTVYFSTSGTYFYSGGGESVLVKWDQANKDTRKFLPRLPAPIKHITVAKNNIYIAVATEDNGVQIISPQLNIVNVIQHLVLGTDISAGIIYDSRSKMLILNGVAGHIQSFSPKDLSLAYSLDVVGQNKYTNEREKIIINTTVTKVAINNSGLWMATIEHRCDTNMFESRLKFWFFDTEKQKFSLNTSIEFPHEDYVKDVVFQPSPNQSEILCITIGKDKKCKIWQLLNVSTVYYTGHSWNCSGEVTYKDLMPQVASFSNDGSLIAVGFESVITIWLSNVHELKSSLKHPLQDDNITHLSFGCGSECHLLFCATPKCINIWNLLSLSMVWTVKVDVSFIVSDMTTSLKALFTKDKKLYIIDIKSPDPIYVSKKILKNVGDIQAAQFVPKPTINSDISLAWHQRSSIYFLDTNYELYSIETKSEETDLSVYIPETDSTLYSNLLPEIRVNETSASNTTHLYQKDNKSEKLNQLLDTPAHTASPLHLTCERILQSMIFEYQEDKIPKDAGSGTIIKNQTENGNDQIKSNREVDISKIAAESTLWISIF